MGKKPVPEGEVYHFPALRRDRGPPFSLISCPQPNVCSEKLAFLHPLLPVWGTGGRNREGGQWSFCRPGELWIVQTQDPSPGFNQDQVSFGNAVSPSIKGPNEDWDEGMGDPASENTLCPHKHGGPTKYFCLRTPETEPSTPSCSLRGL